MSNVATHQLEEVLNYPSNDLRSPEIPARAPGGSKVLFLGNPYNPFSTICLKALTELEARIVVGLYDPSSHGTSSFIRSRLRTRGWKFVLDRGLHLVRCKTRIALRKKGVPLVGFASIPEICRARGLSVIHTTNPNSSEFVQIVRSLGIDLIVVAVFGRILKPALIGAPRLGCVNVHPSLLPRYRGPEPGYWMLANGEKTAGVSVHYVDEGIDTGDVILQKEFGIRRGETERTLMMRSARASADLLREAVPLLLAGKAQRARQDHSAASYYSFPPRGSSARSGTGANLSPQTRPRVTQSLASSAVLHEVDPLQDPRWTELVERHPRSSPFHAVSWLRALQQTYGYSPVVYTTSPPGSDLRNGVVLCRVHSWLTGSRLVGLPFSDHCEPLIDSADDMESILHGLQALRKSGKWKYVELRPRTISLANAQSEAFRPSNKYHLHTIDLRVPQRQLFDRFHKDSIQRRIRRAERAGLTHECGRSEILLQSFYRLLVLTRRRHRMPPQPLRWFSNLVACMGEAIEIHVTSRQGQPIAAVITLRLGDKAMYKYGGSDQAFHALGSMPFTLWKAIQQAQDTGAKTFDLGRSDCGNRGLVTFKDRWASTRTELNYVRYPAPAREFAPVNEGTSFHLAQNVFGLLPNSALELVGKLMYRHVA